MPHIVTPFLVTVNAAEQLPMRMSEQSHAPSFAAALHTVVFTRHRGAAASSPTTVSLVVHYDAAGSGPCSFTIASHIFAAPAGNTATDGEDAVAVKLRTPIVFSSRDCARSLEVKCTAKGRGAEVCAVTIHGTQRTFLTHEQLKLLCKASSKTKLRNGTTAPMR